MTRKTFANNRAIREQLRDIDECEDIEVSQWESEFLQSMLYDYTGPMSQKQEAIARRMIDNYRGRF